MSKSTKHTARNPRKTYARNLPNGEKLEAEVSPCVFMNPGYPLQISVRLQRQSGEVLAEATAVDRTKTAANYTDASVERLLAGIRSVPCSHCSTPAFDPATVHTNRNGLCEACFLSDLKAVWAAEEEAEQRKIAARDQRMKRKGMAVRVSGWVHPETGGDDHQVDWYLNAPPTAEQVKEMLHERGSSCLDDYQIIIL
jgi:hypothetical protein